MNYNHRILGLCSFNKRLSVQDAFRHVQYQFISIQLRFYNLIKRHLQHKVCLFVLRSDNASNRPKRQRHQYNKAKCDQKGQI